MKGFTDIVGKKSWTGLCFLIFDQAFDTDILQKYHK